MLIGFCFSTQGKSHEEKNLPCQDYSTTLHAIDKLGREWAIAAVADGVGSCSNSQYGSETAVLCAANHMVNFLTGIDDYSCEDMLEEIRHGFEFAADSIIDRADEMQMPPLTFDTTLTLAVMGEDSLYYGHCGDGGIVVLYKDGTYEMISTRHKGEEATSVYPLRVNQEWEFGYSKKPVASAALMTDGVLDNAVNGEELHNRVYFPFFRPIMTAVITIESTSAEDIVREKEEAAEALTSYVQNALTKDEYRTQVRDDLTIAAILSTAAIESLPDIVFDQEAWDRETTEFNEKRKRALEEQAIHQMQKFSTGIRRNLREQAEAPSTPSDDGSLDESIDSKNAAIEQQNPRRLTKDLRQAAEGLTLFFDAAVQIGASVGAQARERINKALQTHSSIKTTPNKDNNPQNNLDIEIDTACSQKKKDNDPNRAPQRETNEPGASNKVCDKRKDVAHGNTAGKSSKRK